MKAMKKLPDLALLDFRYKLGEGYWLNVQEEVLDCCINQMSLDSLIEQLSQTKREGTDRIPAGSNRTADLPECRME